MSLRRVVGLASLAVVAAACSGSGSKSTAATRRGTPGATFTVEVRGETAYHDPATATTLMLPSGGRVTAPGGIDCGISGGVAATRCRADFPWGDAAAPTTVPVTATPDGAGGYGFFSFAGACTGSDPCTVRGNADAFVLVRFAQTVQGLGGHPNLSDPLAHGPAYRDFVAGRPGALACTACHGGQLEGRGLALSCTGCHAHPGTLVVAGSVPTTGGIVSLPEGPVLAVGTGALATPTTLTVGVTSARPALPPDAEPVTAVYEFGPSGLVFSEPITVTFPIPPGVTNPVIYWTTPDGTAFEQVGGVVVGDTIQAQITHFSKAFVGVINPTRPRAVHAVAGVLDIKDTGYRLSLMISGRSATGAPMSSVTVSGPGIVPTTFAGTCPWAASDCFNRNFFLPGGAKPAPGSIYTYDVTFSDGSAQLLHATVADLGVGYPEPVSPASSAVVPTTTPRFVWNAPAGGCVSSYVVLVNGPSGRVWGSTSLPPSARAVTFNANGSARMPELVDGPYTWSLFAFDCSGSGDFEVRNSARVINMPFTVSAAGGGYYRVRGVVSGLSRSSVVLTTPGEPPITVQPGATGFAFPYLLPTGAPYDVAVLQQPIGETCVVLDGSGVIEDGNTNIALRCDPFWNGVATGTSGFSAAVLSDGTLWAWGAGASGQLGIGFTEPQLLPVQVGAGYDAIAAGHAHALALQPDGTLWSWGSNGDGQLGDGTTLQRALPMPIGGGFATVAASRASSAAIALDGTLWMWGDNSFGQLGLGHTIDQPLPVPVGTGFVDVSARSNHTLALMGDGTLWGWGANAAGELGIGRTSVMETTPVWVGSDYAGVATGAGHTLALKRDGTLWAWGSNSHGQLGDGSTVPRSAPILIGSGFASIAARGTSSFAVRTDATLWAWGNNASGQLGIGSIAEQQHWPALVGPNYAAVSAGGSHTIAMRTNGSLWGWGANGFGQLGDGTATHRLTPVPVIFPP